MIARFLVLLALGGWLVGCGRDALVGRLGSGGLPGISDDGSAGRSLGGQGGQAGQTAVEDASAERPGSRPEAGLADASGPLDGGDGGSARCTVAVDGGTASCTTTLAAASAYDYFCGLKNGTLNCWGSTLIASLVTLAAPVVAAAPPNLVQLALSANAASDHTVCGVDENMHGFCWSDAGPRDLGTGLRAVALSPWGECKLALDGSTTCDTRIYTVPTPPPYLQIAVSDDMLFGLDTTGVPSFASTTFPAGTYTEIAVNLGYRIGAVRSDGAAVTSLGHGSNMVIQSGSWVHLALDDSGRACGIDRTGALGCWIADATSTAALFATLPAGPFVQIVGGSASFCALRASGTTACWGDQQIDVPTGW